MHLAARRLLTATALLGILILALGLRFYGMDWAIRDAGMSYHPDERHYDSCAAHVNPQWLAEEEYSLPFREQVDLLVDRNLRPDPDNGQHAGLRPVNYNYGTLPLYMYLGYEGYLTSINSPPDQTTLVELEDGRLVQKGNAWTLVDWFDPLSTALLLLALWIGLRLFVRVSRDLRASRQDHIPWYQDMERIAYFFLSLLLPLLGLIATLWAPTLWVDLTRYTIGQGTILLTGRMLTAWAGAFTVLIVYLIARDAFGKLAGLFAALMLATAMLHVQTSHFATVDVILGFFVTAAIYAYFKASQTTRFYWYFLATFCTGLAVGCKWSGLLLVGMLWVAHAIAVYSRPGLRTAERWIHIVLLIAAGIALLLFLRAASSIQPTFDVAIASYGQTLVAYSWLWLLLGLVTLAGSWVLLRRQLLWDGETGSTLGYMVRVYRPWLWFVLSIPVGIGAFFLASPMAFFEPGQFARDLVYQTRLNGAGEFLLWYTYQYVDTPPVWYSLNNLFYPSLDYLTAFAIVGGCLYSLVRLLRGKSTADFFLLAWVIPAFVIFSSVHSKFPRYLLVVLPVMAVLGGRFLADWVRAFPAWAGEEAARYQPWIRRSGLAFASLTLLCGLLYGVAYVGIYSQPHTLVQLDRYIRDSIRSENPQAVIAVNNVDEGPGYGYDIGFHYGDQVNMQPDEQVDYYVDHFSTIDYLVFRSKRPYGSTLQYAEQFPMINQMFRALFAEQLGFRIRKVISNPPRLGPFEFRVDEEDETARIYDHPKIIIFEKVQPLSREALRQRIANPPDWVRQITAGDILTATDRYPVYAETTTFPALRWYVAIQMLGLIAFVLMFPLVTRLPDRAWSIAKPVGVALFAWCSWILASTGLWHATDPQRWGVFFVLGGLALAVGVLNRQPMMRWLRHNLRLIVTLELLFLVIVSLFLGIRSYHPANTWGERPMNTSFINATYRAEVFPPEDPWYAGNPVNYYYYGHMVFSTVAEWAGLEPQYVLNVSGTSITAMVALAVFGLVFAFTRNALLGGLGIFFALFMAPVSSFFQALLEAVRPGAGTPWNTLTRIFWRSGEDGSQGGLPTIGELVQGIPVLGEWMLSCLKVYTGFASDSDWQTVMSLSYDRLFWASRTLIPGTAANEYPAWTHLFLDFHAHMLVWPFTLSFLLLLYALFSRHIKETSGAVWAGFVFLLALLLGTIICTNTWDLPGMGIALVLAMTLKFWRESDLVAPQGVHTAWTTPTAFQRILQLPLAPIAGILIVSFVLLFPFHDNFESRVSGIGWMVEGQTSPFTYFFFFAPMLFPVLAAVLGWAFFRPDGGFSYSRSDFFTTGLIASVFGAIFFQWFFRLQPQMGIEPASIPWYGWLTAPSEFYRLRDPIGDQPLDFTVVGLMLPVLVMLFLGLWNRRQSCGDVFALLIGFIGIGLSLGIEGIHIDEETWSIPGHRWNTAFKFHLQVWMYLAIVAPVACLMVWHHIGVIGRRWSRGAGLAFILWKRFAFVVVMGGLIAMTLPLTVMSPAMVMFTHGAKVRDALPPVPTLDGFRFWSELDYGTYAAIHWFNRFVDDTPTILEMPDGYYDRVSRFSTYTGLPTVIGWAHHVGERIADPAVRGSVKVNRTMDADRIYLSRDRDEVRELLNRYDVEYVVFGDEEARKQRNFGTGKISYDAEALARLEQWTDLYELVFRSGSTSVFRVIRPLNPTEATPMDDLPEVPASLTAGPLPGVSMFEGRDGAAPGQFRQPRALITDPQGYVYVMDTFNHRMQVFRPGGLFVWSVGSEGAAPLQFREPNGIDLDPATGNIYVADTWNGRIVLIDKFGNYLGNSPDFFYGPRGVAFHPERQQIYVSDTGSHRIAVLKGGELVDEWKGIPQGNGDDDFNEPNGIDIDRDGNIVVADTLNFRVKTYTPEGERLSIFPIETVGIPAGGFEAKLVCAPDGSILVTDPWEASVHVYSPEGELQRKISRDLRGEPLRAPVGITLTPDNRILVTDLVQNRVVAVQ